MAYMEDCSKWFMYNSIRSIEVPDVGQLWMSTP